MAIRRVGGGVRTGSGLAWWVAWMVALGWAGGTEAQNLGGQRFVPASSEDGVLGTEGAERRVPLHPYVALWLNYGLNPVILLDANDDEVGPLVEHLLAADLTFSINVWKGLEFGLNLPITLVREGDDAVIAGTGLGLASGAAIGDLELRAGYRFDLSYRDGLGLYVPVLLPTAADDDPLALGFGVKPTLVYTHGFDALDLHLNLSVLLREGQDALDYEGGSELGLRGGLRIRLDRNWDTSVLVDLGLVTPFSDVFSAAATPFEPRIGIDHWFNLNWRITGFVGFGITGGVGSPDFRLGLGVSYGHQPTRPRVHPAPGDRDGDGYSDDEEAARDAAERGDSGVGDGAGRPRAADAGATRVRSMNAQTSPRTSTASRTKTAAPTMTTTRTAWTTWTTNVPTSPRPTMGSPTTTAVPTAFASRARSSPPSSPSASGPTATSCCPRATPPCAR